MDSIVFIFEVEFVFVFAFATHERDGLTAHDGLRPRAESPTVDAVATASTGPVGRHSTSSSDRAAQAHPRQPCGCHLGLRTRIRPITTADGVSGGPSSVADTTVSRASPASPTAMAGA